MTSTVDLRNLYRYLSKVSGVNRKIRARHCARKREEKVIECRRKKACDGKREEGKKKTKEREYKPRKPCAFGGQKY